MSFKDVLTPVVTIEDDEAALIAAGEVAAKCGARPAALIVAIHLASEFAKEARPLSEVLTDIARGSQSQAALEREKILAWLERSPHEFEVRDMTVESALHQDEAVAHARMADLVVMARGHAHAHARRMLLEHVLFRSGRPLLLVPEPPPRERRWDRALIGWSAKPEAVHAVTAALPLLQRAQEVVVATIDAVPSPSGHGQAPGRELAAYLARHGVRVEVRNIDGLGRSEAKALTDEALGFDADMIVMGAYGHSRAQEFLFGGVTRELLAASPIPLFLAH
jgi:nucleotide-binding universal stress UspA family protein